MKILIGADIVPTKANEEYFAVGDVEKFVGKDLLDVLSSADYRIFDLEVPFTDGENKMSKFGANMKAKKVCIAGVKNLGTDFVTLANNHIMDYDEEGLEDTLEVLEQNGIEYAGLVGRGSKVALVCNKKIGIYCLAEREFSVIDDTHGVEPYSAKSLKEIEKLNSQCDKVIVLFHGGKEYYPYPSPNVQTRCREFVNAGADLVICQHTHCIGCEEKYNGSTIVYGQGNFIFDGVNGVQEELLVVVEDDNVEFLPLIMKNGIVDISHDVDTVRRFENRSDEINNKDFVASEYVKYVEDYAPKIMPLLFGKGYKKSYKIINVLSHGTHTKRKIEKFSDKEINAVINLLECETHREVITTYLRNLIAKRVNNGKNK